MADTTPMDMSGHKQDASFMRRVDNFMRGAADGLTGGFADKIAGVADGVVHTLAHGGSIKENIKAGIVAEQQLTTAAKDAGAEYHVGKASGAATLVVTAGAGMMAAKSAVAASEGVVATSIELAKGGKAVNDLRGSAHAAAGSLVELGTMTAPVTPKIVVAGMNASRNSGHSI